MLRFIFKVSKFRPKDLEQYKLKKTMLQVSYLAIHFKQPG